MVTFPSSDGLLKRNTLGELYPYREIDGSVFPLRMAIQG